MAFPLSYAESETLTGLIKIWTWFVGFIFKDENDYLLSQQDLE